MNARRTKTLAIAGVVVALALLTFTAGSIYAGGSSSRSPEPRLMAPATQVTHEQMHQMMDAVHGEGTSQRMHEAMGEDAERLMDQCVAMMGMMQQMPGMTRRAAGGPMQNMTDGMMGR